jgi:hypothetical protein
MEQGKLTMWVDLFSMDETSSATSTTASATQTYLNSRMVNITPRKPKKFQLRIHIYNTEDVILDDVNLLTGERASDIYVRAFMCDKEEEAQKTDTHFRSLNGEGKKLSFFIILEMKKS